MQADSYLPNVPKNKMNTWGGLLSKKKGICMEKLEEGIPKFLWLAYDKQTDLFFHRAYQGLPHFGWRSSMTMIWKQTLRRPW